MDKPDVEFSFDPEPFVAAGLDPAKLRRAKSIRYEIEGGRLMLPLRAREATPSPRRLEDPSQAPSRKSSGPNGLVGYHEKLDHYGIKLGDGNMFEWAKDMAKNDKDIVFA